MDGRLDPVVPHEIKRSGGRTLVVSLLAYWTLMTWPFPLAHAVLAAMSPPRYGIGEAIAAMRVLAGGGAALTTVALCAHPEAKLSRFLRAGAFGGALTGAGCIAFAEVVRHPSTCPSAACKIWLASRTMLMGGFWAAPFAVPVGVGVAAIVWLLAGLIGAIEMRWRSAPGAVRASAVLVIMLLQSALGFWLHRFLAL